MSKEQAPVEIGKAYIFRGVTYHVIGKVEEIRSSFAVLSTASWLADSGRFADAVKTGVVNEVEPTGDGHIINLNACNDIIPWVHELPTEQK